MNNLKTSGCIPTFYVWNDCTTIADLVFSGLEVMRAISGELELQICMAVSFWCTILCLFGHIPSKLLDIYGHLTWLLYYQKHFICGLELQDRLKSYSPEMYHSPPLMQHCVCTHCTTSISKSMGHLQLSYTPIDSTAIQDDSSCVNSSHS